MALKSWNRIFKANNVIQSLRPLTYVSYVSLAPFGFNLNAKNKMYIPIYTFVIGFVFFLSYLWYRHSFDSVNLSIITDIAIFPIFVFAIIMRWKLVSSIQKIIHVVDSFKSIGIRIKYPRILRYNFFTSISLVIFFAIYLGIQVRYVLDSWYDLFEITMDSSYHLNVILFVLKYVCLTHLAQSLFSLINEVLCDILKANTAIDITPINPVVNDTSTHQSPENAVKQISDIHDMLCDVCQTIEDYFAYPLLATLASSSCNIILAFYFIVVALFNLNNDSYDHEYELVLYSTEAIYFSVIIFVIAEVSRRTVGQSSSSASIVHRILNKSNDLKLKERLQHFSQQLIHQKVSFTAAGLINLDRSLILAVASAAVCYIIILAQFYPEHFKEQTKDNNKTDCMHCLQLLDRLSCINIDSNVTDLN